MSIANFAKLPSFKFGSKAEIYSYLDAIARLLKARKLVAGEKSKNSKMVKEYNGYAQEFLAVTKCKMTLDCMLLKQTKRRAKSLVNQF